MPIIIAGIIADAISVILAVGSGGGGIFAVIAIVCIVIAIVITQLIVTFTGAIISCQWYCCNRHRRPEMGPLSVISGIVAITIVVLKLSFLWRYLLLSFPHLLPIIVDGVFALVISAIITVAVTVSGGGRDVLAIIAVVCIVIAIVCQHCPADCYILGISRLQYCHYCRHTYHHRCAHIIVLGSGGCPVIVDGNRDIRCCCSLVPALSSSTSFW